MLQIRNLAILNYDCPTALPTNLPLAEEFSLVASQTCINVKVSQHEAALFYIILKKY